MSKASEWAAQQAAQKPKPPHFSSEWGMADVLCAGITPRGEFSTTGGILPPAEALRLAAWITDTFSEGKTTCGFCGQEVRA